MTVAEVAHQLSRVLLRGIGRAIAHAVGSDLSVGEVTHTRGVTAHLGSPTQRIRRVGDRLARRIGHPADAAVGIMGVVQAPGGLPGQLQCFTGEHVALVVRGAPGANAGNGADAITHRI